MSPKTTAAGHALQIGDRQFARGVSVEPLSVLAFLLEGGGKKFAAAVGVDNDATAGSRFRFFVIGDRRILFRGWEMRRGDVPQTVSVDLTGIQRLGLLVMADGQGMSRAYSDWADAQFVMLGDRVPRHLPNADRRYLLTPPTGPLPRITSPAVFGARPGNPFLFTVTATGTRPMVFAAEGLPAGLSLEAQTGIITGRVARQGDYTVELQASNAVGQAAKEFRIRIGDTLALTPPMGWNGWNSWAREITGEKVLRSARAMADLGLKDHGWSYINIDDTWQGQRGGPWHAIQPNEKFPDFKHLVDQIHSLGLKVGLYSTPWISSYAGGVGGSSDFADGAYPDSIRDNKRAYRRVGKYRFETSDARQMAEWGIDYLKYDWRLELESAERMGQALRQSGRDIVYSLSNSARFEHARDWARISNLYRTGSDIRDSWLSLYDSLFLIDKWGPYAGPGHWNDPDMMIVGNLSTGSEIHATRLTPDEQYSEVSLYCLLSAPLVLGCPLEQLDAFTLNLLTNDEVIGIDQDPLGRAARFIADDHGIQIWLKPMADGSWSVGLFNTDNYGQSPASFFRWGDEGPKRYSLTFRKLGLQGKWRLRDVWRQADLGVFDHLFEADIPHHGVILLKMQRDQTQK